ncbi:hypothetical protein RB195_000411 [Necator americanus]|uniref:Uncharacterized protein n=1 Tax=Necator americanus TaxID=51031 RepID=A0ABR1DA44_NECAM
MYQASVLISQLPIYQLRKNDRPGRHWNGFEPSIDRAVVAEPLTDCATPPALGRYLYSGNIGRRIFETTNGRGIVDFEVFGQRSGCYAHHHPWLLCLHPRLSEVPDRRNPMVVLFLPYLQATVAKSEAGKTFLALPLTD